MKYVVEMGLGAIYTLSFIKLTVAGYTDNMEIVKIFFFLQNKESRLKMYLREIECGVVRIGFI
jgi:hypothetical protein